ncbi:MAG: hypothetical protein F4Y84_12800, partial [Caldilineaceae bacterium SB0665_bin_25]|nr:hypothetical protein [Caldilineaceae bacterium SB0665_bin_25]
MTSQEPTYLPPYLSQGVNYLGFLSQQLGDLRGITALAHELIQNADDAKDDSGKLSATRISFDFRDDALVVSNDSSFRQIDFDRIQEVASGSKRSEIGDRTTGAFGVGFISVYQVTDRPEIHSAGRRWTIRPDKEYEERIHQVGEDPSITKGTRFILPWAFQDSRVRQELRAPTIKRESIETFVEDLRQSFPKAILFLKKLEMLELFRNGSLVLQVVVRRKVERKYTQVDCNNAVQRWRILEGDFSAEARKLKDKYGVIEANRSPEVQLAIPDSPTDTGLLFATLPTKLSTDLPFHIDADFFPTSDRKSIVFGDHDDPRSEWNRAALRVAASTVERNLIPIRDMFANDASKFWAILNRLYAVHNERENDWRMPLGVFWECLVPSLGKTPIVYSESGKWLPPSTTCIPSMREEKAVPAFKALGIHLVQRNLWTYRNVLITVGVRRLAVKDIYDALKNRDLIEHPQTAPADFEVGLLWQGIHGVLDNTNPQHKDLARSQLQECSLAPGLDGRMWPCRSAFQSDCQTRQLFDSLLPNDVTFLAQEDVPLLQQLCPLFTPNDAINVLECLDSDVLQARWRHGDFDPTKLLQWFDDNKSNLTEESLDRLAKLPIFPSAKNLHPLEDLWLPGGFDDPTGVADLLDMSVLEGLSDFLQSLGVKKLTFEEYAMRYIAEVFAVGSAESIEIKRKHLENLERYIGEIRVNQELRKNLAVTNIVECIDCVFRQPSKVYFPCEEVKEILGDHTNYASLPQQSEGRWDLYRWLGVKTRPRIKDMLRIIEKQTRKPPDSEARATVVRLLVAIGKDWPDLDDNAKALCNRLRTKKWLPAERDTSKWYSPDLLAATFNKILFASQAKFIDVPYREQQSVSEFMKFLGVQLSPQPRQVVDHLLMCSIEFNQEPPRGVYQWLNDNAKGGDFGPLKEAACLWVKGKYLRPAQVFWGRHSFGRFRVQLGSEFKAFQYLLNALGIREAPDFNDAIEVLKDVSKSVGTKQLQPDDRDVVLQCWVMLSEALQESDLDAKNLRNRLRDTESIPNDDGKLRPPSWMFFEDRPGLADKFPDQLRGNCISRIERVWTAMAAAGVKPISQVVKAEIHEFVDPAEDEETAKRFTQRATLINTILSKFVDGSQSGVAAVSFDKIRFFRTDELNVKWRLHAFDRNRKWPPTSPEPVKAFFDSGEKTIYFTAVRDKDYPWSAIARELSFAVAPDEGARDTLNKSEWLWHNTMVHGR